MDKKTIIAFVLIGFILILTQTDFYREKILKMPPKNQMQTVAVDSTIILPDTTQKTAPVKRPLIIEKEESKKAIKEESKNISPLSALIKSTENKVYNNVIIESDDYRAEVSPKGAVVTSWILKKYNYKGNEKVQLIQGEGYGNLGVFFINDEDTLYTFDAVFEPDKKYVAFEGNKQSEKVNFVLDLGDGRQLIKTFTFYKSEYIVDLNIEIRELARSFDNNQYFLQWKSGLKYSELDYSNDVSKEDVNNSRAYVFQGGSKEELKLANKPFVENSRSDFSGVVDWTAIRTKYFAMIILPDSGFNVQPILGGKTVPIYKEDKLKDRVNKIFSITLKNDIPISANLSSVNQKFRVYIGPLDYFVIKKYHSNLAKIMDFGMSLIRPFAKLVLRAFIFLHGFIPNYGVVLVLFAILVKLLVWPLTRKSYASMHRMQTLQPKMNELKEKYAKDPQRLNKETMKLYKQEGVNPVSGCLPQLLQMPLLFAIFIIFRNTIELRGADFIFWIKDLSAPDTIFQLPMNIPMYGDLVNVLPIIMGVTMFLQQKMTMKDPKQKAMVYFMPIFFTLLFNSFPSGLNLYYTLFNIFSIAHQRWMPDHKPKTEEPTASSKAPAPVKTLKAKGKRNKN